MKASVEDQLISLDGEVKRLSQQVEQVVAGKFNPKEPSAVVEQSQAMHDSMKAFMEINLTLYLCLGGLDFGGTPLPMS